VSHARLAPDRSALRRVPTRRVLAAAVARTSPTPAGQDRDCPGSDRTILSSSTPPEGKNQPLVGRRQRRGSACRYQALVSWHSPKCSSCPERESMCRGARHVKAGRAPRESSLRTGTRQTSIARARLGVRTVPRPRITCVFAPARGDTKGNHGVAGAQPRSTVGLYRPPCLQNDRPRQRPVTPGGAAPHHCPSPDPRLPAGFREARARV
jgi:hypothetical protein